MNVSPESDFESGFASTDPGHVVAMCAAAPGWFAVFKDDDGEWRSPVAAWVITETVSRYFDEVAHKGGRLFHSHTVYGVNPTGEGWDGSLIEQEVEYRFEPGPPP